MYRTVLSFRLTGFCAFHSRTKPWTEKSVTERNVWKAILDPIRFVWMLETTLSRITAYNSIVLIKNLSGYSNRNIVRLYIGKIGSVCISGPTTLEKSVPTSST